MADSEDRDLAWRTGLLKEGFLIHPKGARVFMREYRTSRPLSVGRCWVLRAAGSRFFHTVAEDYGGRGLSQLVKLDVKEGQPVLSPPEKTSALEDLYSEFRRSLPKGARRMSAEESAEFKSKRADLLQNTVNIQGL
jgi:hypothetical protein